VKTKNKYNLEKVKNAYPPILKKTSYTCYS